jgi:hypothetical protein
MKAIAQKFRTACKKHAEFILEMKGCAQHDRGCGSELTVAALCCLVQFVLTRPVGWEQIAGTALVTSGALREAEAGSGAGRLIGPPPRN